MSSHANYTGKQRSETVLVLDDKSRFLESVQTKLKRGGFTNVLLAIDFNTAKTLLETAKPAVALVDIHLGKEKKSGLEFVKHIVRHAPSTIPVVLSADRTQEQFFRAAHAGAVDFLVKGVHVDIPREVARLLDGKRGAVKNRTLPEIVSDFGYLRSFGMTRKETRALSEFSKDFPKISELARRLEQAPVQLRKVFSRIYFKLQVTDLHQLVRLLTICELFDMDSRPSD